MALNLKKIFSFFKNKKQSASINTFSNELSQFKLDEERISVSGISSGGFVAHNLHLNFPEIFKGVGIFAGGPFGLSQKGNPLFVAKLLTSKNLDAFDIIATFRQAQNAGKLGDINLIKKRPVYIYYSKQDPVVNQSVSEALIKLYETIGVDKLKIKVLEDAGHGLPVMSGGLDKSRTSTPFLINCDFEASHQALEHIYGQNILIPFKASTTPAGKLLDFDQRPFKKAFGKLDFLANQAYVYLPPAALNGERCGVHLALHGCQQSVQFIGKDFINNSGFMDWADKNKLIILFPQTQKTLKNPFACWDWVGIYDKNSETRESKLMQALIAMIFSLQSKN